MTEQDIGPMHDRAGEPKLTEGERVKAYIRPLLQSLRERTRNGRRSGAQPDPTAKARIERSDETHASATPAPSR